MVISLRTNSLVPLFVETEHVKTGSRNLILSIAYYMSL